jgi:molybdopterin-binding protein
VVSVITTNSAKKLGLKVGAAAYAIIKADKCSAAEASWRRYFTYS